MTPNKYQELALKTEKTPYFTYGTHEQSRLVHALFGMSSESGEIADALKKFFIYGKPLDNTNVIEECGDLLWYISLALDAVGATMEEAMEKNIAKLKARYGDKFTQEKALNRDLGAERAALEGK